MINQLSSNSYLVLRTAAMKGVGIALLPYVVTMRVDGRLPRGIGVATLRDAPAEWSLQFARPGLAQP
jgi:hypothetical protein